jgi:hypothetical protein
MKEEKQCQTCNKTFIADSREVKRGNAKYCSLSCAGKAPKKRQYEHICAHCGREFISASKQSKYCSNSCKQKHYRAKASQGDLSMKKFYEMFKDIPCEICNWDKASRDLHHIIEVANEGTNTIDNIICVCPNCHREIHKNLVSKDDLYKIIENRTISSSSKPEELDANSGN